MFPFFRNIPSTDTSACEAVSQWFRQNLDLLTHLSHRGYHVIDETRNSQGSSRGAMHGVSALSLNKQLEGHTENACHLIRPPIPLDGDGIRTFLLHILLIVSLEQLFPESLLLDLHHLQDLVEVELIAQR